MSSRIKTVEANSCTSLRVCRPERRTVKQKEWINNTSRIPALLGLIYSLAVGSGKQIKTLLKEGAKVFTLFSTRHLGP